MGLQEELGVAADNGLDQGIAVGGLLGDGLAEGEGIAASLVGGEVEVVSRDGSY
jgi:hypothetical protein